MTKPVRTRRIVALAAAYVVALQALLLPLSVAAGASFAAGICATAADGTHQPASHESGCPCAAGCGMQGSAQALIGPPQAALAPALTYTVVLTPAPAVEVTVRPAAKGPQVPRAPPAA